MKISANRAVRAVGPSTAFISLSALLAAGLLTAVSVDTPGASATTKPKHYINNLHGAYSAVQLGYNLLDTGSSKSTIDALPAGTQSLVWLGQKCPTAADATFKATVDSLKSDPKVFGYYLSDEPHVSSCAGGTAGLASRADYIKRATGGSQASFIVLSLPADYAAFRPSKSHVDLVGLDPYPCSTANPTCPLSKIDEKVAAAESAGISQARIVPVYQAFGQENTAAHYYNMPTAAQLSAMLKEWKRLIPSPVFDYTYTWGHQSVADPTLVDVPTDQQVLASFFSS